MAMRSVDAALIASGWQNARAFFKGAGKAARDAEKIAARLETGIERRDGTGPRPVHADPTASAAAWAEHVERAAEALEAKRETAAEIVEAAGVVLAGVGAALGAGYADVLDARYIQGMTWPEVEEAVGIGRRTAMSRAATALDWIDSVGWRRAVAGVGRAATV